MRKDPLGFLLTPFFRGVEIHPVRTKEQKKSIRVKLDDPRADFITEEKVKAAIDSFLPHKGPGPDMLPLCVF